MLFSWSNLKPKRVLLYKKKRTPNKGVRLTYGVLGFKAERAGFVRLNELEAVYKLLRKERKYYKRYFKLWIMVYPNLQKTGKALGTRMGRGKGKPTEKVVFVQKGRILVEWKGVPMRVAIPAMQQASKRFSIPVKIVSALV